MLKPSQIALVNCSTVPNQIQQRKAGEGPFPVKFQMTHLLPVAAALQNLKIQEEELVTRVK